MRPSERVRVAVLAAVFAVSGCAGIDGTAAPAEIDVRKLDVGAYPVDPLAAPDQPDEEQGRILESVRMAEAVVDPFDVDPALHTALATGTRHTPKTASAVVADAVRPVLEKHRMLAGYTAGGTDSADERGFRAEPGKFRALVVTLLRFGDEQTARRAAAELDAADRAVSPDNQSVQIAKHPDAHAHWRPNVPTMAATLSKGPIVITLLAAHTSPDRGVLIDLAAKAFDAQLPLLDSFEPTPVDKIASLPRDPDGMLRRVLPAEPGVWPQPQAEVLGNSDVAGWGSVSWTHGVVYGPRETRHSSRRPTERPDYGIDRHAVVGFSAMVRRARDDAAAAAAVSALGTHPDNLLKADDAVAAPKALPQAKCFVNREALDNDLTRDIRYMCVIAYRRYIAQVTSDSEEDVRRKVAAQYALLANSQ